MIASIALHGDVVPIDRVTDRIDELEQIDERTLEECDELDLLHEFAEEIRGLGGDVQWRGDWYPGYAVRDPYFTKYAEEFANDLGLITEGLAWPFTHIDWQAAADDLRQDYTEVIVGGDTFLVR